MNADDYKRCLLAIVEAHRQQRMADMLKLVREFEQSVEYERWLAKIDKAAVALRQLRYQVVSGVDPDTVRKQVTDIIRRITE